MERDEGAYQTSKMRRRIKGYDSRMGIGAPRAWRERELKPL